VGELEDAWTVTQLSLDRILPTEARGWRVGGKQLLFLSNTFCFKDEGAKGSLYACLNIPFQAERGDDEHENEQQQYRHEYHDVDPRLLRPTA
jgi:hypothetical protein